jgi:hypothetical protein
VRKQRKPQIQFNVPSDMPWLKRLWDAIAKTRKRELRDDIIAQVNEVYRKDPSKEGRELDRKLRLLEELKES